MIIKSKNILLLLLLALCVTVIRAQTPDDDEVDNTVPGYPHKIYSGYLTVAILPVKSIHYTFFPSQNDQSADPLVIWFTGGPGCSSLIACFHQNGPFIFPPGKSTFVLNDKSWNKNANVLYFELPAGVGFSTSDEQQIVITDASFTNDTLSALRLFFARFPSYKKNTLYLSGHGYGGVFVAYLAQKIIDHNQDDLVWSDKINLKGILVGNPCVRPDQCYASGADKQSYYHYEFLYNRAFFSKKSWDEFRSICTLNYDDRPCYLKRTQMDKFFLSTNTSAYNIYSKCYKSNSVDELSYINTGCEDDAGIIEYLNDPHVRENWNILPNQQPWVPCNRTIFTEYMNGKNSYELYPSLIKNKLRIWVYSGDVDSAIPIIGTKRWIENLRHELQMPVRRIWRQWWVPGKHKGQDQVGGFIWELRDLTFVSVKNAGLRTAMDQPQAMYEVFDAFINGKTLPYKNQ